MPACGKRWLVTPARSALAGRRATVLRHRLPTAQRPRGADPEPRADCRTDCVTGERGAQRPDCGQPGDCPGRVSGGDSRFEPVCRRARPLQRKLRADGVAGAGRHLQRQPGFHARRAAVLAAQPARATPMLGDIGELGDAPALHAEVGALPAREAGHRQPAWLGDLSAQRRRRLARAPALCLDALLAGLAPLGAPATVLVQGSRFCDGVQRRRICRGGTIGDRPQGACWDDKKPGACARGWRGAAIDDLEELQLFTAAGQLAERTYPHIQCAELHHLRAVLATPDFAGHWSVSGVRG